MVRLLALALVATLLAGCMKTGISSEENRAQSEEWGQEAYEKAMIEAGREDELKAEKEKWAQYGHTGGQEQTSRSQDDEDE